MICFWLRDAIRISNNPEAICSATQQSQSQSQLNTKCPKKIYILVNFHSFLFISDTINSSHHVELIEGSSTVMGPQFSSTYLI